jgi:hypothetical protein
VLRVRAGDRGQDVIGSKQHTGVGVKRVS